MSWKPLDQIYLEQTAFKDVSNLPRKVVNEATAGEVIQLIKDLDQNGLLDEVKDLEVIKKYLSSKPFASNIRKYLENQNLNEKTISEGDVIKFITEILSEYNDVETYSKYIENPQNLTSIGNSGMLIEKIKEITGMNDETIRGLINLIGTESGRGVGRAEIALATVFDDVSMSKSKGDLDWNGEYLEVKGTSARLGKRDRAVSNFNKTRLGRLAIQYDKSDKRLDTLVANLADEEGIDKNQVLLGLKEFAKAEYPHSTMPIPENINLENPLEVRKALTKIYFNNYAEHEGVSSFIFVNTSRNRFFGRYTIFTKDQIPALIDGNIIKSGVITTLDLDPSLGTI
tara:strand:+ start:1968 stop:2993 length:1026 start_codon:yes stop_codon:yes gene_type:complete